MGVILSDATSTVIREFPIAIYRKTTDVQTYDVGFMFE